MSDVSHTLNFAFRSLIDLVYKLLNFEALETRNLYDDFAFIRYAIIPSLDVLSFNVNCLWYVLNTGVFESGYYPSALDYNHNLRACSKSFMKFYERTNAIGSHSKRYRSILRQRHKPNKPWLLSMSTPISTTNFTATRCPNS